MVPVYVHSLSSLEPINFSYTFANKDDLSSSYFAFNSGLSFYLHSAFKNFKDVAFSNKTCLILTDNIPLNQVFANNLSILDLLKISGTFYLKNDAGEYIRTKNNKIFVSNEEEGNKLLFTLNKVGENLFEIKTDADHNLTITLDYPYNAYISTEKFEDEDFNLQLFSIDFVNQKITIKTSTKEGDRFLSWGSDKLVRANGVSLNKLQINNYIFNVELVSEFISYNFNPISTQIKYFTDLKTNKNTKNVQIKNYKKINNHLLVTCPTNKLDRTSPANIAYTKTNCFPSGTHNT